MGRNAADGTSAGSANPAPDPDRRADPEPSERIRDLAARARRDRAAFDPPATPPDEQRALAYLREGFGPAVWTYVEGRTGGRRTAFSPAGLEALEVAMNTWLELYARCHGVSMDAAFTVREAAELLMETHDVRDTAVMLTHVPGRGH